MFHYVFVVVRRQLIEALSGTLVSVQKKLSSVHDSELLLLAMGRFAVLNRGYCGNCQSGQRKRKEACIA